MKHYHELIPNPILSCHFQWSFPPLSLFKVFRLEHRSKRHSWNLKKVNVWNLRHWPGPLFVSMLLEGVNETSQWLPVGIHALRIASLFFFRPNVVIIPMTAKVFFLAWVPPIFDECFGTKPSCVAAARSISRSDNFFCCSLENKKNGTIRRRSQFV